MARVVQDRRLDNRSSRLKLPTQSEPFWRAISEGCHLGYRRGIRGGKWVARYRPPGRPGGYNKTTLGEADDFNDANGIQFLDFRQAQDAARHWFEMLARGEARGPYTVSDCLDDYLEAFRGKSIASTRARVEAIIRPALGPIEVSALTTEQIARWHRNRANSPAKLRTGRLAQQENTRPAETDEAKRRRKATANRDLTVLKAALNCAYRNGKILRDEIWRRVRPFGGVDEPKLGFLEPDQMRRLTNACEGPFRQLVQAALLTGARYGELIKLRAKEVDLTSRTVRWLNTKAGKARTSYLSDDGFALFSRLVTGKTAEQLVFTRVDGSAWKSSQQRRPLHQACTRAGIIPAISFHDLRRSYGALLATRGVPLAYIAEALGHADERITRRHYAHLVPSHVAQTIREHLSGLGIVQGDNVIPLAHA